MNHITNLPDMSGLNMLETLDLGYNSIGSINGLSELVNLKVLSLRQNGITDIQPLIMNSGISSGDSVNIVGNPLNEDSTDTYIPELEARGVEVFY